MPRPRRPGKARRVVVSGWDRMMLRSLHPNEVDRPKYLAIRDELLAEVEERPGRRPAGWWYFEPGIPTDLRRLGLRGRSEEDRLAWLLASGRMSAREIAALARLSAPRIDGQADEPRAVAHGAIPDPGQAPGPPLIADVEDDR